MIEPPEEQLQATVRLIKQFPAGRCSVAYLKWRLGIADKPDSDSIMREIRDALCRKRLIGWSYPPKGPAEFFLVKGNR